MKRNRIAFALALLLCLVLLCTPASASDPTDEIVNYEITADVNEDGTVNLHYHIDWKVLRDDIGALEWITVGIPNGEYVEIRSLSDTIASIGYSTESGSSVRVDFDRSYRAGETVSFDYLVVQDYMYQMNLFQEGQTAYVFTPGWFDEIAVDNLTVRWNSEDLASWSPDCLVKDGYNVWTTSLAPGDTYQITVNYPNEARAFNDSKAIYNPGERSGEYYGFMDIFGKFACVIGPALYELFYGLTGKPCFGILSLILLFACGFLFLTVGKKHFRIVEHKERKMIKNDAGGKIG